MNQENHPNGWLKGLDLSHHQEEVDWAKLKADGWQYIFLKATEGGTYTDPTFAIRREECRRQGLPTGFYHFFRPKGPVRLQIENFLRNVGRLQPGELPPVLDLEVAGEWKSNTELKAQWYEINLEDRVKMVVEWCEAVEAALGVAPIIYMSSGFAAEVLGNAPVLSRWLLWVANYTTAPQPRLPQPWSNWAFWQYSESGRVDGIPANDVDLNWFNGTVADLARLQVPSFARPRAKERQGRDLVLTICLVGLLVAGVVLLPAAASWACFGGAMALAMAYTAIFPDRG